MVRFAPDLAPLAPLAPLVVVREQLALADEY